MAGNLTRKNRLGLMVIVVGVVAFGVWVSGIFTPWSAVNCWTDSIDIHSGRVRHERFLLYRCVSDKTEDGPLTQVLLPGDLAGVVAEWHPVVTFSPGVRNSPHYAYHGAFWQVGTLQLLWQEGQFTSDAKRASALHLLKCWGMSGGESDADRALVQLAEAINSKPGGGGSMDVSDLPAEWR